MVFDPIISAQPSYETRKGVADERKEFVKEQMDNVWSNVGDILRGLDYGWVGFEKVWRLEGSRYVLDHLKPLNVNFTGIVTDPHGAYAGLRPMRTLVGAKGNDDALKDLGVHKSWIWTYDGKFGNLYGRSRLENMRATAWRDWLDAATDLVKLSRKISGKFFILYTPTGQYKGTDGNMKNWSDLAATVAMSLNNDASLLHVYHLGSANLTAGQQNFEQFVELMKTSAVRLELQDFGSNAPAISGLMERMKQNEEKMFAGYFQSPRTGMATVGGTKADAQQHTDTATINAENVAGSIARALSKGVIDDILTLNFGEGARGDVWMAPAKLTDDNVATDMALIDGALANTDGLGTSLLEQVDWDVIADRRGIAHKNPIVLEAMETDTMGGGENQDILDATELGDNAP